jgi:glycosyltransferase involved in cell wall biosynthesis
VILDTRGARVALVHDYMTQLGGAERLAGVLATAMPDAGLLTSVHLPERVPHGFIGNRAWKTSFLQSVSRYVPLKAMLPALPHAISALDVRDYDVVLSTSSAFAHHARAASGAVHVCYCSAPAHFLWNPSEYFRSRPQQQTLLRPLLDRLRSLDVAAAQRVDTYVANSAYTASRIRKAYGRESTVVYPPVEHCRFEPSSERSGHFLVVSRLVATKHVDLVVEAANHFELPLDVIGCGPELPRLQRHARDTVRMLGWQADDVVRRAMASCIGVVVAGEEDFGLVMPEAQASGRPPIAFASGGALEIIEDGVTGYLFEEQTPECLGEAMLRARDDALSTADLRASAERFDVANFFAGLQDVIDTARGLSPAISMPALVQADSIAAG